MAGRVFYRAFPKQILQNHLRTPRILVPGQTFVRPMSIRVSGHKNQFSERGYILLVIPLATFGLGTWQVHRRKWKLGLIAELEEKTRAAPIPLPDELNDLIDLEYRKVSVKGQFDHSREILLGPRTLLKEDDRGGLMTKSGNSGYHIITPFRLENRPETILVNRGWVAHDQKNPKLRQKGQIEGMVDLVGVVRKNEHRPQFQAKNDPARGQWFYKDLIAMGQWLDTEPVLIDADRDSTVEGGPIGGQTKVTLRNEHFNYIVTWYSLSAATLWMWYTRYGYKFIMK